MDSLNLPRERAFLVRYLAPTNTRGSRVKIKDLRRGDQVTVPYDYRLSYIYEMAAEYLKSRGIRELRLVLADTLDAYVISTPDFETSLKA